MKIRAIIFGSPGMIGEGVLMEALDHPNVESVLVINRRACLISHPNLKELIIPDLFDLSSIKEPLHGYNACFFFLEFLPSERAKKNTAGSHTTLRCRQQCFYCGRIRR